VIWLDEKWLEKFFAEKDLWPNRTGQGPVSAGPPMFGGRFVYNQKEDIDTKNLGLGWIYYSVARLYKPKTALIIGSGRGFTPLLLAKGIKDNNNGGILHFIDPSLDDDFWKDANKNRKWFAKFGLDKVIIHYLKTTQEFVKTQDYKKLDNIELLFIDASHFYEFVKFDFDAFEKKVASGGIILFHDSISRSKNPQWSGARKALFDILKKKDYQSFDFKFGAGLTLVQKKFFEQEPAYIEKLEKEWRGNPKEF